MLLVALYFLLPKKCQWVILLLASAAFYLTFGWKSCGFILVTIVSQYFLAMALERKNIQMRAQMDKVDGKQKKEIKKQFAKHKKWYVLLSVLINLGILVALKYTDLAIGSINRAFGTTLATVDLLLPIGLSYYTFKSIGYVIDVYRGRIPAQKNIFKLALYIGYFPALIQGPIDRYEDIAEQLYAEHDFDYDRLCFGAQRMLWGYIKKLVIAERAAVIINTVQWNFAAAGYEGFTIFFMMLLGSVRIYTDFSGGMDIVLGLSEIFGIKLTENFERPYFSTSISEYWQRWHITLGAWMRTYVFYPLSLSQAFSKLGRKCRQKLGDDYGKLIAPSLASFITFFLVGMWHGAGWAYVPFSLYNGLLVALNTLLEDFYAKCKAFFRVREESKIWRVFQSVRTYFMITMGNYLIVTKSPDMVGLIKATFSQFNPWIFFDGTLFNLGLDKADFCLLMLSIVVLLAVDLTQERGVHIRETIAKQNIVLRWCVYFAAVFTLIIFGMYGPGYNAADFVYMRF